MKRLLEAFALFVQENPEFTQHDSEKMAEYLRMILDADPEKVVLRQALEYYANDYNWPYEVHSPDGLAISGMEVDEATEIAKHALQASDSLKRQILESMLSDGGSASVFKQEVKAS